MMKFFMMAIPCAVEILSPVVVKHGYTADQVRLYLTQSVFKVVLQKSIPPQIRQLILYVRNSKG